jgi:hypothetical protein
MGRTYVVDVCYTSYEGGENSSPHEDISSRPLGKCEVLVHILPLNSSAPVLPDCRTHVINAPSDSIFRLLGRAEYVSFTFSLIQH